MKREIVTVDKARGILQATFCDERWYVRDFRDEEDAPQSRIRPSVSWIASGWPKGPGYEDWLKRNGYTADQIVSFRGDEGFLVHLAVAQLNAGESVKPFSDKFIDQDGQERTLTYRECQAVMSYVQWRREDGARFKIIGFESVAWPDPQALAAERHTSAKYFNYGGMVDIDALDEHGAWCVIDLKISKHVYMSHRLQVEMYRLARQAKHGYVLQLDYPYNKKQKYKLTEVRVPFAKLRANWEIWEEETRGIVPLQRDYPLEIRL